MLQAAARGSICCDELNRKGHFFLSSSSRCWKHPRGISVFTRVQLISVQSLEETVVYLWSASRLSVFFLFKVSSYSLFGFGSSLIAHSKLILTRKYQTSWIFSQDSDHKSRLCNIHILQLMI